MEWTLDFLFINSLFPAFGGRRRIGMKHILEGDEYDTYEHKLVMI
jgi:hypothetical protein